MHIHVVAFGETVYSIANQYGVSPSRIISDNQLEAPYQLAVGSTLVILIPSLSHTVLPGETLFSIAQNYNVSLRQLYRNNPFLSERSVLSPGDVLFILLSSQKQGRFLTNAYAYPFITPSLLNFVLPYLSWITPFTYGFSYEGTLLPADDEAIISAASRFQTAPLLHFSTLSPDGGFDSGLAGAVLNNPTLQERVISQIIELVENRGYLGVDLDFEYIPAANKQLYYEFIVALKNALNQKGYPLIVALAPKTYANQPGLLYEAHDYAKIGSVADYVFLMTYEWGYRYSAPMAVAPINKVREVVSYAVTEVPPQKILLGIPLYGYDWVIPHVANSSANSLSCYDATVLAATYGARIEYDAFAASPYFRYTNETGISHEVWFEDARSIQAKLALASSFGLAGIGYWHAGRKFPQNWLVLNALYEITDLL